MKRGLCLLVSATAIPAVAALTASAGRTTPWIVLNEDRDQFACQHVAQHPDEPITREVVCAWADRWFRKPVTHCFVNPNAMTVFWDSKVFERQFDVHRERRCTMERDWRGHDRLMAALEDMFRRGVDPHAIFIEKAREKGIEPWLSMRMNDVHYPGATNYCYTSRFWMEHPECWRKPDFFSGTSRSNFLLAFNYAKPLVRELHLKGLAEMLDRYDVDGVELDWMRHHFHFAPGRELEDAHFLTEFMREAKRLIDAAGRKKGRRLPIAVRVTTRPDAAINLGMDFVTWAKEDLFDVLIVSPYFDSNDMQVPISEWKRLLAEANPKVKFILGCEPRIGPEYKDVYNTRPPTEAEWNGWVARGFDQGAEGFYFFNHYSVPRETGFGMRLADGKEPWTAATFRALPQAYPASYCDAVSAIRFAGHQVPVKLDAAHEIVINIAPPPKTGTADVAFVTDAPIEDEVLRAATVNGVGFSGFERAEATDFMRVRKGVTRTAVRGRLPVDALKHGDNVIRIGGGGAATLVFCEIEMGPARSADSPREKPLVRIVSPRPGTGVALPRECAFGSNTTFYVRLKARVPSKPIASGVHQALIAHYAEHAFAFQMCFKDGVPEFSVRTADGGYCPLRADFALKPDEPVELVGIRHGGALYLSVNGGRVFSRRFDRGTLDLRTPQQLEVEADYHGSRADFEVQLVEVGRGWPPDVSTVAWPTLGPDKQVVYDSIFEPKVVGVPPSNSGPGYFHVSDGGVLRLLGRERYGERNVTLTMDSHDLGLNWETRVFADEEGYYGFQKCPWADYRLYVGPPEGGQKDRTKGNCRKRFKDASGRSVTTHRPVEGATSYGHLRPLVSRRRWLYVTHARTKFGGAVLSPVVCWSDDDGETWRHAQIPAENIVNPTTIDPPHEAPRWRVGCQEADVVERRDGTLLMIARASTDHHVWYESKDGGETWSKPVERPAFWSHNTQPMFLRLRDGRILLVWNNTQILPKWNYASNPELKSYEADGTWETVFTNRDALHAAISEDDGKTWIGFREIALNDIRNREDYREVGNEFWSGEIDKSVHQPDAVELPGGKIAVVYGQNKACRRVAIFDVRWLYERGREEDLRRGTANLSNHLYLKSLLGSMRGWSGHCSLNRIPGAAMVREPDTGKDTRRECLQICRIRDERLVDEHQGVVWNFPAARSGQVEFECRIDGAGVQVALCDHWINPSAPNVRENAFFVAPLTAKAIGGEGKWTTVSFSWDLDRKTVTVCCEDRSKELPLRTEGLSPFGVSYLHLQTLAEGHDPKGAYFRWFRMKGAFE